MVKVTVDPSAYELRLAGRDEMNLAEYPIFALSRAPKVPAHDGRLERVFEIHGRDGQPTKRLTVAAPASYGLPTIADLHVLLALLAAARHEHNFKHRKVHFATRRIFEVMRWSPNSRSYDRLERVLNRLKHV